MLHTKEKCIFGKLALSRSQFKCFVRRRCLFHIALFPLLSFRSRRFHYAEYVCSSSRSVPEGRILAPERDLCCGIHAEILAPRILEHAADNACKVFDQGITDILSHGSSTRPLFSISAVKSPAMSQSPRSGFPPAFHESPVDAVRLHKRIMCALLCDLSAVYDNDLISITDGFQPA